MTPQDIKCFVSNRPVFSCIHLIFWNPCFIVKRSEVFLSGERLCHNLTFAFAGKFRKKNEFGQSSRKHHFYLWQKLPRKLKDVFRSYATNKWRQEMEDKS